MWLIVGLGNPGKKYETTRHNIGFIAADYIAEKLASSVDNKKYNSLYTNCQWGNDKVIIVKPQTYMNLSGSAVQSFLTFYKIPKNRIIVIHDDLDLPSHSLRIKLSGGHGGHNGLRNILSLIGPEFYRVRYGINRPEEKHQVVDFVLDKFTNSDLNQVEDNLDSVFDAIELIIRGEFTKAQQLYNKK